MASFIVSETVPDCYYRHITCSVTSTRPSTKAFGAAKSPVPGACPYDEASIGKCGFHVTISLLGLTFQRTKMEVPLLSQFIWVLPFGPDRDGILCVISANNNPLTLTITLTR